MTNILNINKLPTPWVMIEKQILIGTGGDYNYSIMVLKNTQTLQYYVTWISDYGADLYIFNCDTFDKFIQYMKKEYENEVDFFDCMCSYEITNNTFFNFDTIPCENLSYYNDSLFNSPIYIESFFHENIQKHILNRKHIKN